MYSGVGLRHLQTSEIITGKKPDILKRYLGLKEVSSSDGKRVIFPEGKELSIEECREQLGEILREARAFLEEILKQQEEDVLIIGGRVTALAAGLSLKEVKSATIYHIWLTEKGKFRIEEIN